MLKQECRQDKRQEECQRAKVLRLLSLSQHGNTSQLFCRRYKVRRNSRQEVQKLDTKHWLGIYLRASGARYQDYVMELLAKVILSQ